MNITRSLALIMAVMIASCELPEKPYDPPKGLSVQAAMGPDYADVVYFDFESDTAMLVRPRDIYDLQWSPDHNFGFRLNSSGFGQFKRSASYNFSAPLDTAAFPGTWQWSHEGADLYQEDLGRWIAWDSLGKSPVFALLPGLDVANQERQLMRVQFERDALGVSVYWSPWSSQSIDSLRLEALGGKQYLHFDHGMILRQRVEPASWDWFMGQYVDQDTMSTTGEILPYVVRGVLIPEGGQACKTSRPWGQLHKEWVYVQSLEERTNVIGYDWKHYSFASSSYVVDTAVSYIVERPDGNRYALRFLDYYNDQGVKGYAQSQWKLIVD